MEACRHILRHCILSLLLGVLAFAESQAGAAKRPLDPGLLAEAREGGTVPVLIELDVPFSPGQADTPAARRRLQDAQTDVLIGLRRTDEDAVHRFTYIPFLALEATEAELQDLEAMPHVVAVTEDEARHRSLAESTVLIGATKAWDAGLTGRKWTIAILDTGVDKRHPFLHRKVISEACYSEINKRHRATSLCPNRQAKQLGAGAGRHCKLEGCEHGTHVAGIAAGQGKAFSGVAKDAKLIAIQVFSRVNDTKRCKPEKRPCITAYDESILAGLEQVFALRKDFNIAAANLSLGGGKFKTKLACEQDKPGQGPAYKAAIALLATAKIATVVAASNEGFTDALASPACIPGAVSVGATDKADNVAAFSNSAPFLDLLAPGVQINSSVPGNGFDRFDGTSMAAPHVAGAWAVMRSSVRFRHATVSDVLKRFRATGPVVLDPKSKVRTPRLQLNAALGGRAARK